MNTYQCWFCGQGIDRDDSGAVAIQIERLCLFGAGSRREEDPWQAVYAHSTCAKERLRGIDMELEPSLFGEED